MNESSNLPAQIAEAIVAIPKGLTPGVIKALDHLVASSVDVPVAWLNQQKAKIDAKTESYRMVESSIAEAAASQAGGDPDIGRRAVETLVRKEYRKQENKEAVAAKMVEEVLEGPSPEQDQPSLPKPDGEPAEDWLNLFERYAEDASSERLQGLWGRVLAGEIRNPGRYSPRTLRFLSECSQSDALLFEEFALSAYSDVAPKKLVDEQQGKGIRNLIQLEASGLIQGATGRGLSRNLTFDDAGYAVLVEGSLCLGFTGEPGAIESFEAIVLTQLGRELLSLLGGRNAKDAARSVAYAVRTPSLKEAHLGILKQEGAKTRVLITELLWDDDEEAPFE